jgi:hypothetical protein
MENRIRKSKNYVKLFLQYFEQSFKDFVYVEIKVTSKRVGCESFSEL